MSGTYGLLLNSKEGRITIHRNTLAVLGHPLFVQFLIDPAEKILVLLPCDENLPGNVAVPQPPYQTVETRFRFKRRFLVRRIFDLVGWRHGLSYQVYGDFAQRCGGVAFALEEGVRVEYCADKE